MFECTTAYQEPVIYKDLIAKNELKTKIKIKTKEKQEYKPVLHLSDPH